MAVKPADYNFIMQQFNKMYPVAVEVNKKSGVPVPVLMAQWAHETAYPVDGYSHRVPLMSPVAQKANNWAGIKKVRNSVASGTYGAYAQYSDSKQFIEDYSRVIGLNYYKAARVPDVDVSVKGLAASPWAETHYGGGDSLRYWISTFNLTNFKGTSAPVVEAGFAKIPVPSGASEVVIGVTVIAAGLFFLKKAAGVMIPDFK